MSDSPCICPTQGDVRVQHPSCPQHGLTPRCPRKDCQGHWHVTGGETA